MREAPGDGFARAAVLGGGWLSVIIKIAFIVEDPSQRGWGGLFVGKRL